MVISDASEISDIVAKLPLDLQAYIKDFVYGDIVYSTSEVCINCGMSLAFVDEDIYYIYDTGLLHMIDNFCSKSCLKKYIIEL